MHDELGLEFKKILELSLTLRRDGAAQGHIKRIVEWPFIGRGDHTFFMGNW